MDSVAFGFGPDQIAQYGYWIEVCRSQVMQRTKSRYYYTRAVMVAKSAEVIKFERLNIIRPSSACSPRDM